MVSATVDSEVCDLENAQPDEEDHNAPHRCPAPPGGGTGVKHQKCDHHREGAEVNNQTAGKPETAGSRRATLPKQGAGEAYEHGAEEAWPEAVIGTGKPEKSDDPAGHRHQNESGGELQQRFDP